MAGAYRNYRRQPRRWLCFRSRCVAIRCGSRCAIRKLAGCPATIFELIMVKVLYAIFVADLAILNRGPGLPPSRSPETRAFA